MLTRTYRWTERDKRRYRHLRLYKYVYGAIVSGIITMNADSIAINNTINQYCGSSPSTVKIRCWALFANCAWDSQNRGLLVRDLRTTSRKLGAHGIRPEAVLSEYGGFWANCSYRRFE